MIVLDASVLIAHLDPDDAHHATAEARLRELADEPWAASAISLAEVLVAPARAGSLPAARRALEAIALQTIGVGVEEVADLAALRARTRLPLPDCCVLIAAEMLGGRVLSFDERLMREAEARGLA